MEHFSIYLFFIQDIFISYLVFTFKSESIFYILLTLDKYNFWYLATINFLTFMVTMIINYYLGYFFIRIFKKIHFKVNVKNKIHVEIFLWILSVFPISVALANFLGGFLHNRKSYLKILVVSLIFKILQITIISLKSYLELRNL
ncbi:MAG: hypothetical protein ISN64_03050 [Rickettsia sp.]|nr:hypothetical protein [Rickettsia sp.]